MFCVATLAIGSRKLTSMPLRPTTTAPPADAALAVLCREGVACTLAARNTSVAIVPIATSASVRSAEDERVPNQFIAASSSAYRDQGAVATDHSRHNFDMANLPHRY